MSAKTAVNAIACAPGTLPGGPVRTRFFDGMFLTQADLENEQRYWRLKRRLTNRALGEGVVWGLKLGWNRDRRAFTLSPGYALDCCGNDLVVECPVELTERELWTRADPALRSGNSLGTSHADGRKDLIRASVVLQYSECVEDARPVHRDACGGPSGTCEPSRVRESARLLLVPPPTRAPLSPPELFLKELEELRASITDPALRDLLFPPQPAAPVAATADLPLSVRVTVPGSPEAARAVVFPASGTRTGASISADQTPSSDRRTGVVTFQLLPVVGWQLVGGRVTDQGRVVESVTPPAAPSMYWSLDVALPAGVTTSSANFDFVVDDVELGPSMGTAATGRVRAHVTGTVLVTASQVTNALRVEVNQLTVAVERADGFSDAAAPGCLRELVPWGWTATPGQGARTGGLLVLAGVYGALSELVARHSRYRTAAAYLYAIAWYLLFGVNPTAAVPETLKEQLTRLILTLYARWCNGLAYPGPRCTDEHHGIYLGSVELDRSGAVASFDMWEDRRYVLTGPVVNHWLGQVGVAPVDVIVGRFAQALCCLSALGPITLPPRPSDLGNGVGLATNRFHVGTIESVGLFAQAYKTTATWVPLEVLGAGFVTAMRTSGERVEHYRVYASVIEGGGRIAIAVPDSKAAKPGAGRIHGEVLDLLRRGQVRARERGRDAVGDFTERLLASAPVTALLDADATEAMRKLATVASARGARLAEVATSGSSAILAHTDDASAPGLRGAASDLVDLAEWSVDRIATSTVEKLGADLDRTSFGHADTQRVLVEVVTKALPQIEPRLVLEAARATAAG